MSTTVDYTVPTGAGSTAGRRDLEPPRPRGRVGIAVVLMFALVVSGVMQGVAYSYRSAAINRNRPAGAAPPSRVANLDSFSLALLLGGLRGPLVMFLWSNSENQKNQKDLESFDTQVELIRLLQPEFASVHLFQMWNKAYNVSVQLASLANKYAAILDALKYGEDADHSSPNDLNILNAIGGLYADKLGNSAEKEYYRRRVRQETQPVYKVTFPAGRTEAFRKAVTDAGADASRVRVTTDGANATAVLEKQVADNVKPRFAGDGVTYAEARRQDLRPAARAGRRTELDTMLDGKGNLLPHLVEGHSTAAGGAPGAGEITGAELPYLVPFQPFTYGISPVALGFNYYKRGQVLQTVAKQKHLQLSEMVVDNQPGLTLKMWAEEEWERGRRTEQRAMPAVANADAMPRELKAAAVAPDAKVVDRVAFDEAVFSYERAAQAADAALPEFERHIKTFPRALTNHSSHMDNLRAIAHLTRADARYLRAVAAESPERRKALLAEAGAEYRNAAKWFLVMILRYYTEEVDAAAARYDRNTVQERPLEQLQTLIQRLNEHLVKKYRSLQNVPNLSDYEEYDQSLQRIGQRLELIGKATQ